MDDELAAGCKNFVTSVALRDDVVTRFSPQSLAALHEELRVFDMEAARKVGQRLSLPGLLFLKQLMQALDTKGCRIVNY